MAAVSDFSARVSKQAGQQQRIPVQIGRLTEANLYRHTIISPPSREAKLKHILDYVELQRELIALEEDLYRTATERSLWRSSSSPTPTPTPNNNNNSNSRNNNINNDVEVHSRSNTPPALLPRPPPRYTAANVAPVQEDSPSQSRGDLHRQSTSLPYGDSLQQLMQQYPSHLHQPSSITLPQPPVRRRSHGRTPTPQQQQQQLQQQQQQQFDLYPDGLDPRVALPRALPRSMAHHDQSLYRDSFYSGIGQENDWRQLEELDPDSLAGIHLYGDTSDLQLIGQNAFQQQQHQQSLPYEMSPAIASSPLNKYPIYELTPARPLEHYRQQEQQYPQQQPPSPFNYRPMHYPGDDEEEMEVSMATRHRRQHSASMLQQQQQQLQQQHQQQSAQQQQLSRQQSMRDRKSPERQLYSPTSNPMEKEKKQGRFSTRFSFLTRRRQPEQQHHRHESMPGGPSRDPWLQADSQAKYQSLGHRSGRQAAMAIEEAEDEEDETSQYWQNGHIRVASRIDSPVQQKPKSGHGNRVKQLFKDVFGRSSKKNAAPEPGTIQEISLPDTHRTTPPHLQHQRLYGSPSPQIDAATFQSPYSYSTHSMLPPRRAMSPVSRPSTAQSMERQGYYPGRASFSHNPIRESLVDPIQYSLSYTNLNPGDENEYLIRNQANSRAHSPYALTSLTPPPSGPPPSAMRQSMGPRKPSALLGGMLMSVATASAADQQQLKQGDFMSPSQQQQSQQQQQVYKQSVVNNVDRYRARRSSQLIPIPKDNVDSGCDSVGGYEPHTTASNATTLHPNLPSAKQELTTTPTQSTLPLQVQQQNGKHLIHHIPSSSIDFDRDMTLSSTTYDNGPVLVSMAQVQKVDLEGLCAQVSKPYKSALLSLSVTNPPHIAGEDDEEEEKDRTGEEEDEVIDPKNFHPLHTHPISMVVAVESPYFMA
ncbi:hypothetical protein EMPS_02053 [Entomortierella parvispora]|uniref:Uncharacterized protein n=1 Tax=Entomortierella parvispora TaxID=205924 RepID=A0A9P3H3Z7_9FUNG|nr:hypothetical protein EMPS_02053 [Entomortierella parvispora]